MPDPVTPLEESAKACNKHVVSGKIEQVSYSRFMLLFSSEETANNISKYGLCNYPAAIMKEWLEICEEKGYAKPGVYQGHYNVICRDQEADLYPLLREHGIKINAYG